MYMLSTFHVRQGNSQDVDGGPLSYTKHEEEWLQVPCAFGMQIFYRGEGGREGRLGRVLMKDIQG